MAYQKKDSARRRIINLKIGKTIQFPVCKARNIRTTVSEIKQLYKGYAFTTATTPSYIKVTCTARPTEPTLSK